MGKKFRPLDRSVENDRKQKYFIGKFKKQALSADKEEGDFNIMLEKPKPYRKGTLNMTKVPIIR